jgi:hypothetical protein
MERVEKRKGDERCLPDIKCTAQYCQQETSIAPLRRGEIAPVLILMAFFMK